jgi:hypothetical protein
MTAMSRPNRAGPNKKHSTLVRCQRQAGTGRSSSSSTTWLQHQTQPPTEPTRQQHKNGLKTKPIHTQTELQPILFPPPHPPLFTQTHTQNTTPTAYMSEYASDPSTEDPNTLCTTQTICIPRRCGPVPGALTQALQHNSSITQPPALQC